MRMFSRLCPREESLARSDSRHLNEFRSSKVGGAMAESKEIDDQLSRRDGD